MNNPVAPANALVKLEKISSEQISYICSKLEQEIAPHLIKDVSSYAPNRRRIWMPYEAPLDYPGSFDSPFVPGLLNSEIWQWITSICHRHDFTPHTCLISKGGTIKPHRDTTYASPLAFGINLGNCSWHISSHRDFSKPDYTMNLSGGEVFKFNCKHIHAVTDSSPDRWAINVWTIANSSAAHTARISQRLNTMFEQNPQVYDFVQTHTPSPKIESSFDF